MKKMLTLQLILILTAIAFGSTFKDELTKYIGQDVSLYLGTSDSNFFDTETVKLVKVEDDFIIVIEDRDSCIIKMNRINGFTQPK